MDVVIYYIYVKCGFHLIFLQYNSIVFQLDLCYEEISLTRCSSLIISSISGLISVMFSDGAGLWLADGCCGSAEGWDGVLGWPGDCTEGVGSPLSGGLGLGVGPGVTSSWVSRRLFFGVTPTSRRSSGIFHLQ